MFRLFTNRDKAVGALGRRGFTLVELLVVVSIIALLIAILLPSLRRAREQAKLAVCLANMTGIAKASLTYAADDPNDMMIPIPNMDAWANDPCGAIEWGGKSGIGQSASAGEPALSLFGTANWRGPAHRPLNNLLYKGGFRDYNSYSSGTPDPGNGYENWIADTKRDLPIYRCPSDTGFACGRYVYQSSGTNDRNHAAFRDEGLSAYDHYGTSYVANTFWISGGVVGDQLSSQSVYMAPLSRVPSPAASIAYQEVPSRYAWLWGDWDNACSVYAGRVNDQHAAIPGWHRQDFRFNVSFADGHASSVDMKGTIRPAPNLGLQNYPAGNCVPSMSTYDCERCVTLRGTGWQMDTLPAQAVLTPFFAVD